MCQLIAKIGGCAHSFQNGRARRFLFHFQNRQSGGCVGHFLLADGQFLLGSGKVRRCRLQYLPVTVAFFFQRQQPIRRLRKFRLGSRGANRQFGAAFFVGTAAGMTPINFDRDLIQSFAILPRLGFDRISPLGALGMLRVKLLHALGLVADFLAQLIDLRVERKAFLIHLRELAGQHHPQFGAHFIAQAAVALCLAGLPLERVHLPRDFFKNIVDAIQVHLRIFEPGFGEAFLRLELCDARGFFNHRAAIGRTAAQDLPDASLLDERVRLRSQAGAHE